MVLSFPREPSGPSHGTRESIGTITCQRLPNLAPITIDPLLFLPPIDSFPRFSPPLLLPFAVSTCGPTPCDRCVSTWTLGGGGLAPRRANERYTAELSALVSAAKPTTGVQVVRSGRPLRRLDSLTPGARRAGPLHPRGRGLLLLPASDFRARVRSSQRRWSLRQLTFDPLPSKPARRACGLSCGNRDPKWQSIPTNVVGKMVNQGLLQERRRDRRTLSLKNMWCCLITPSMGAWSSFSEGR
jgi:hypothetical protein